MPIKKRLSKIKRKRLPEHRYGAVSNPPWLIFDTRLSAKARAKHKKQNSPDATQWPNGAKLTEEGGGGTIGYICRVGDTIKAWEYLGGALSDITSYEYVGEFDTYEEALRVI